MRTAMLVNGSPTMLEAAMKGNNIADLIDMAPSMEQDVEFRLILIYQ